MHINWHIEDPDISLIRGVVAQFQNHQYVLERHSRNIRLEGVRPVSRNTFWQAMIVGLLTTQQRSGANSKVGRFLQMSPHPLALETSLNHSKLESYVQTQLQGFRRNKIIAKHIIENLDRLGNSKWQIVEQLNRFLPAEDILTERRMANELLGLIGIGPKQSRNMLQNLGLTRYEIPLDSRVIGWINRQPGFFPIHLEAKGLTDTNYYEFVLDGIQMLCAKAGIMPCIFDAAVFACEETTKS